jgi:hypothetical protein
MAKFNNLGRGVSDLIGRVKRGLDGSGQDELAEAFARDAASIIQRRTRGGKGVAKDGGTATALKPLSRDYIKRRRRSALSSFTSAARSNLTFTSELLGSMSTAKLSTGKWFITFEGTRDDGLPNARLAQFVSKDRPFLYLARDELAKIQANHARRFDALVKRKF